jgi:DNA-binding transcriptional ArsR family regulator
MQFEPIKYVVPGFIAEGLTLFAGKPKIGKSWLLMHAAHAVAEGGYTLGGISCEQGDVLYAALEDNLRRVQSRMSKLFGEEEPWPNNLHFMCEMPRLAEGGIERIRQWIESAKRPRLVIIDTLAMVRMPNRKDQNSYDADYTAVKDLRALAAAHGVAIVVVHHLRKADADDAFDTVSGTLGLTGAPDTIIVIRRETNGVLLQAKGCDIEEISKAITFDQATCTWTITGDADTVRRTAQRAAVISALEDANGEPVGASQIASATGMKPTNVRQLLLSLKREGLIKSASYGKYVLTPSGSIRMAVAVPRRRPRQDRLMTVSRLNGQKISSRIKSI